MTFGLLGIISCRAQAFSYSEHYVLSSTSCLLKLLEIWLHRKIVPHGLLRLMTTDASVILWLTKSFYHFTFCYLIGINFIHSKYQSYNTFVLFPQPISNGIALFFFSNFQIICQFSFTEKNVKKEIVLSKINYDDQGLFNASKNWKMASLKKVMLHAKRTFTSFISTLNSIFCSCFCVDTSRPYAIT